jgi:hypothetical protein
MSAARTIRNPIPASAGMSGWGIRRAGPRIRSGGEARSAPADEMHRISSAERPRPEAEGRAGSNATSVRTIRNPIPAFAGMSGCGKRLTGPRIKSGGEVRSAPADEMHRISSAEHPRPEAEGRAGTAATSVRTIRDPIPGFAGMSGWGNRLTGPRIKSGAQVPLLGKVPASISASCSGLDPEPRATGIKLTIFRSFPRKRESRAACLEFTASRRSASCPTRPGLESRNPNPHGGA